jgi:hypothetical protein
MQTTTLETVLEGTLKYLSFSHFQKYFVFITISIIFLSGFFYLPTDAQLNCLKNNSIVHQLVKKNFDNIKMQHGMYVEVIILLVTLLTISSNRLCTLCSNDKLEKWLAFFGHITFISNDALLSFCATAVT